VVRVTKLRIMCMIIHVYHRSALYFGSSEWGDSELNRMHSEVPVFVHCVELQAGVDV
jgi:hypothetical protein